MSSSSVPGPSAAAAPAANTAPLVLAKLFPRAGFCWQHGRLRILRNNARNAMVYRAIVDSFAPGTYVRKREAMALVTEAVEHTVEVMGDPHRGIKPDEGIIDFLERAAELSALGAGLDTDVWVELMYQIVWARQTYKSTVPLVEQHANHDQLSALAFAADKLRNAAATH
ncbi:hypothetical protein QBC43DRAFT_291039 [Cladorrhinum sp. PSN259]|nr:hypothetical protein QBC43DRAFT_291039 [Cladorrhinum sp. PSN259]